MLTGKENTHFIFLEIPADILRFQDELLDHGFVLFLLRQLQHFQHIPGLLLQVVDLPDLLLQVVDGSDPHCREHIEVTKKTIAELGAGHIPMITVFNKSDLVDPPPAYPRAGLREESAAEFRNENVYISAKQEASVEFLAAEICERLMGRSIEKEFLIPYSRGDLVSLLMEKAEVLSSEYTGEGTALKVRGGPDLLKRVEKILAGL